eukprot:6310222-Heterocapsa_arctica.AAC.1
MQLLGVRVVEASNTGPDPVASSLGPGNPEPEPEPLIDRFPMDDLRAHLGGLPFVPGSTGTCPSVDFHGIDLDHPKMLLVYVEGLKLKRISITTHRRERGWRFGE